jgi:diaminopimelate epimerase
MRFTKMHGAGNDYVYVDLFDETVADAPALARAVSDRHTGIGGDGLILLAPSDAADVKMIMYNADGSRAQMCGNGVRCLAKLARDRGRAAGDEIGVETDDGIKAVRFTDRGIRVDMGAPRVDPAALPAELPGTHAALDVLDRSFDVTAVSMGNPHVVTYVEDVDAIDVARYGAAIETDPRFPERTNVEFVQVLDESTVRQRTWERGSGETQACGTGACAVCVAGVLTGRTRSPLRNRLLGGELLLEWDGEGSVFMTGPAVEVFTGDFRGM